jgi:hypothetical protein
MTCFNPPGNPDSRSRYRRRQFWLHGPCRVYIFLTNSLPLILLFLLLLPWSRLPTRQVGTPRDSDCQGHTLISLSFSLCFFVSLSLSLSLCLSPAKRTSFHLAQCLLVENANPSPITPPSLLHSYVIIPALEALISCFLPFSAVYWEKKARIKEEVTAPHCTVLSPAFSVSNNNSFRLPTEDVSGPTILTCRWNVSICWVIFHFSTWAVDYGWFMVNSLLH